MPPANPAVHALLVRQHRAALRTPVHPALFLVRNSPLQHPQEKPLVPPVIFRLASGNFSSPVKAESKPPQRPLKFRNVLVGPGPRMRPVLDRRIFCRQAKRVPSHRVQHVEPAHPLHASNHIPNRVVAHVPHVHRPRRVRQHFQHIVFGFPALLVWHRHSCLCCSCFRLGPFSQFSFLLKAPHLFPPLLPLHLNLLRLIVPHAR